MKIYPRKFLFLTYIVLPLIAYSIILYFTWRLGEVSFHWYITVQADSVSVLEIWIVHAVLSLFAAFSPKEITIGKKPSKLYPILLVLFFIAYIFVGIGYLRVISFAIFIILIVVGGYTYRVLGVLLFFSILGIIMGHDRFPFVIPLLLWLVSKPISFNALLSYVSVGVLTLIFILSPIKSNQPLSEWFSGKTAAYAVIHLNPIFVSGIYFNENKILVEDSVIESIPFAKSTFNSAGTIQELREGMVLLGIPGDFGSNSSALPFTIAVGFSILAMLFQVARIQYVREIFLVYSVLYAPYFLRRNYANYINDILTILLIGALLFLAIYILKSNNIKCFASPGNVRSP